MNIESNNFQPPENTKYIVHFQDNGQDFLLWFIDESGTVIDCQPFQAAFWVDCFVLPEDLNEMQPNDELIFINKFGNEMKMKHRIEKVEILTLKTDDNEQ